jgi:hypothetical protein
VDKLEKGDRQGHISKEINDNNSAKDSRSQKTGDEP